MQISPPPFKPRPLFSRPPGSGGVGSRASRPGGRIGLFSSPREAATGVGWRGGEMVSRFETSRPKGWTGHFPPRAPSPPPPPPPPPAPRAPSPPPPNSPGAV
ncbi:hypothetical protein EG864_14885 [Enterococcus faecalis]|nr:hypothetical protein EG864_14885 [Enterococcus faecalis]